MLDDDDGLNGEIQAVEVISAVGSRKPEARSHFKLVPTALTLTQSRYAEFQLEVAESLENIGDHVSIAILELSPSFMLHI